MSESLQRSAGAESARGANAESVKTLVSDLGSKDAATRDKAHEAILNVGEPAVHALVSALASRNSQVRWEANKILAEMNVNWAAHADEDTIESLISDLGSKDGLVRVRARMALVTIGEKAVGKLEAALDSKEEWKRWEAAKALGQIGDPSATEALVRALDDDMFDLRWLAAEGLISIGSSAVVPLLRALMRRSDSIWLREGAHRVLHSVGAVDVKSVCRPVVKALEDVDAQLKVPFAAEAALEALSQLSSLRASSGGR